jgi:hypothetical protein
MPSNPYQSPNDLKSSYARIRETTLPKLRCASVQNLQTPDNLLRRQITLPDDAYLSEEKLRKFDKLIL